MTIRFAFRSLAAATLALVALLGLPSKALALDAFWVVKVTDMDKKVEYKIMSPEEYKSLETDVKAENSLFAKAEEMAKKEWKTAEEKSSFPGRLNPRKIEILERATVREKADTKLEKLSAAEERKSEPKKTTGKPSDADKKAADAKAEKEKELQKAYDLVKGKLAELVAAAKEKSAKADEKPDAAAKP
jgi:hypothetical protein